jgi:hypothetical protein
MIVIDGHVYHEPVRTLEAGDHPSGDEESSLALGAS